jgi:hypothetical protein
VHLGGPFVRITGSSGSARIGETLAMADLGLATRTLRTGSVGFSLMLLLLLHLLPLDWRPGRVCRRWITRSGELLQASSLGLKLTFLLTHLCLIDFQRDGLHQSSDLGCLFPRLSGGSQQILSGRHLIAPPSDFATVLSKAPPTCGGDPKLIVRAKDLSKQNASPFTLEHSCACAAPGFPSAACAWSPQIRMAASARPRMFVL